MPISLNVKEKMIDKQRKKERKKERKKREKNIPSLKKKSFKVNGAREKKKSVRERERVNITVRTGGDECNECQGWYGAVCYCE